ncbi:MAG: sulfotransferase family protein [Candidatus Odinarchaeia archaeon]|nr:MAG: p-loop containing NTP hydrolase [Lokiarchaeota virus Fenrir Meg22_1012]URC17217.1 MAG: sulfotransferase [Lokiarchaeota virus Fenrir Meg22_1214]
MGKQKRKRRKINKIFCIGLPRTGTVSITNALKILGYESIHFVQYSDMFWRTLDIKDAFSDMTICCIFELLDCLYPNSKFIYTIRRMDEWLKSSKNKFSKPLGNWSIYGSLKLLFGKRYYDEELWKKGYIKYDKRVRDYFKDREQDLLIINICEGKDSEKWEKICTFLNKPIPDVEFPYLNKYKKAEKNERHKRIHDKIHRK